MSKTARAIMLQGTGSHVGKSVLVSAMCRIFSQDGYRVAPFKAQNMALNSFVTPDGGEIGRAQAVQAQAAGLEPTVDMNPVLLKPTADVSSQVIVHGRPVGNCSAFKYHRLVAATLWPAITASYRRLAESCDIIVMEGAGSPAEVNLQDQDVVNMRPARMAGAPVLLVADIDKGGALASVVGTLELVQAEYRDLFAGIIINKFRGDRDLLQPALDFLVKKTGLPVAGVIPFYKLQIPEEDSVNPELRPRRPDGQYLEIAVLYLPHVSNFTDCDPLEKEPDVYLRYVRPTEPIENADLVIIPGSKNTIGDLETIIKTGQARELASLAAGGVPVVGLCGGYQMLGRSIADPWSVESGRGEIRGLGLLDAATVLSSEKLTSRAEGEVAGGGFLLEDCHAMPLLGYEIHMGETALGPESTPAFRLKRLAGRQDTVLDGAVDRTGRVLGTYLHGLFDSDQFRRAFLNGLRAVRGWPPLPVTRRFLIERDQVYNDLAQLVRENTDMELIYSLLKLQPASS